MAAITFAILSSAAGHGLQTPGSSRKGQGQDRMNSEMSEGLFYMGVFA